MKPRVAFVKHSQCPKCHYHGKDKGKNNLGNWSDGSQYCFSCGYRKTPAMSLNYLKDKMKKFQPYTNKDKATTISLPQETTLTDSLPSEARAWLASKHIDPETRKAANLKFNTSENRLVFPVYNDKNELVFTNSRYFGNDPKQPKYINKGDNSKDFPIFGDDNGVCVFIVEDYVSAMRIGSTPIYNLPDQFHSAVPIFGTFPRDEHIRKLSGSFFSLIFFLDADKHRQSTHLKLKYAHLFEHTGTFLSHRDPKDYSPTTLANILNDEYSKAFTVCNGTTESKETWVDDTHH